MILDSSQISTLCQPCHTCSGVWLPPVKRCRKAGAIEKPDKVSSLEVGFMVKLLKVHQVCHTFFHKNKKSESVETHLQIQLKSAMPSGSCTLAIRASGTSHWPKDPKRPRWWCSKYPIDHYATMQYFQLNRKCLPIAQYIHGNEM